MIGIRSRQRLSSLDASFLEVETPTAHMHVGWVALFRPATEGERPTFARMREFINSRLPQVPRYRQKLALVPFGLHDPVWVDDPDFDVRRHVHHSTAHDVDHLLERVLSTPLERDRPLWQVWIADQLEDGRIGLVGKVHHCMVDGIAAVELASLFLDTSADAAPGSPDDWRPASVPGRGTLLTEAIRDRIGEELDLVRLPARVVRSPRRLLGLAADATRAARALRHSISGGAPPSSINEPISPLRRLGKVRRPVADLLNIKQRHSMTLNDVVLAVSAGGVRRFLRQHGEPAIALKAMVPVSVRAKGAAADLGNEVSFVFIELPCDEPNPLRRLEDVHAVMSDRKESGEPRGSQTVLQALGYTPHALQHAVTHAVASARTFNLVVSNIPGPRQPVYMLGCPMEEVYPIVPLADMHAVAIGFTTVADMAYFGVYADRKSVPDADLLARDIDAAIDELSEWPSASASERYSRTA
jgi:diacylglycerol O-acyltransferase / wax synthase